MKVVIIGNGVAGTFSAQNIRNQNEDVEIDMYSREDYPYYTRIKLPELISEEITIEELIVFDEKWHKKKNIDLHLNSSVEKIHQRHQHIFLKEKDNPIDYDKLIIATGSYPNIPPIRNAKEMVCKGLFTLRNIDDALEIKNYIQKKGVKKAIIIGGGLLGLELSRQIRNCDLDTTVVEFFPRLLPKQLDADCGNFLKEEIKKMGIEVVLDAATEEILGQKKVEGIKLKDGREFNADIVLVQAGVRPRIDLAEDAKIETNRGIIVNEYLRTSADNIYAVGDCIEFKSQTWGIIPACIEQSKIIAASVLGLKDKEYHGTVPKNTLKIVGIDLTSIGIFDPEDTEGVGSGWEILKSIDKKSNCYKKIILKDNKLKGAILFGEKKSVPFVNRNIESQVNEKELREALGFYKWKCTNCGFEYDDAKKEIAFQSLPEDWKCKCGSSKDAFEKMEL
ncbi:MAG: NAD(P)/FAD-dependent oxidoreductase [Candidatus Lokiarchaeota archaeon]|nr:NAD(P)/FAD-dependent oxidoreductase [Candidatus Lokiarchaeota archaeon]MBD3339371.1 NAD(P)/FAD-dependent oxidoreductase [Candidatus Lokiarchaeota archaeon]